ncbi:M23 family metallopeptidase [Kordiimonas aestuarii]|uniref:M23 family metallopeptidase n=1 Tax=Kordiimonas aestuarii TaxID=1005925 RepID=UPI0021CF1A6D|nr:peptidoglycan DD-metalloendopeptidase family protein [Kordiimonas aestuarii]
MKFSALISAALLCMGMQGQPSHNMKEACEDWLSYQSPPIGPLHVEKKSDRFVAIRGEVGEFGTSRNGKPHTGVDLFWRAMYRDQGAYAVRAVADGRIAYARYNGAPGVKSSYGNLVLIDHQNGCYTAYTHLAVIQGSNGYQTKVWKVGDRIAAGNEVGYGIFFGPEFKGEVDGFTMFANPTGNVRRSVKGGAKNPTYCRMVEVHVHFELLFHVPGRSSTAEYKSIFGGMERFGEHVADPQKKFLNRYYEIQPVDPSLTNPKGCPPLEWDDSNPPDAPGPLKKMLGGAKTTARDGIESQPLATVLVRDFYERPTLEELPGGGMRSAITLSTRLGGASVSLLADLARACRIKGHGEACATVVSKLSDPESSELNMEDASVRNLMKIVDEAALNGLKIGALESLMKDKKANKLLHSLTADGQLAFLDHIARGDLVSLFTDALASEITAHDLQEQLLETFIQYEATALGRVVDVGKALIDNSESFEQILKSNHQVFSKATDLAAQTSAMLTILKGEGVPISDDVMHQVSQVNRGIELANVVGLAFSGGVNPVMALNAISMGSSLFSGGGLGGGSSENTAMLAALRALSEKLDKIDEKLDKVLENQEEILGRLDELKVMLAAFRVDVDERFNALEQMLALIHKDIRDQQKVGFGNCIAIVRTGAEIEMEVSDRRRELASKNTSASEKDLNIDIFREHLIKKKISRRRIDECLDVIGRIFQVASESTGLSVALRGPDWAELELQERPQGHMSSKAREVMESLTDSYCLIYIVQFETDCNRDIILRQWRKQERFFVKLVMALGYPAASFTTLEEKYRWLTDNGAQLDFNVEASGPPKHNSRKRRERDARVRTLMQEARRPVDLAYLQFATGTALEVETLLREYIGIVKPDYQDAEKIDPTKEKLTDMIDAALFATQIGLGQAVLADGDLLLPFLYRALNEDTGPQCDVALLQRLETACKLETESKAKGLARYLLTKNNILRENFGRFLVARRLNELGKPTQLYRWAVYVPQTGHPESQLKSLLPDWLDTITTDEAMVRKFDWKVKLWTECKPLEVQSDSDSCWVGLPTAYHLEMGNFRFSDHTHRSLDQFWMLSSAISNKGN